jgi:adenylate cyclase
VSEAAPSLDWEIRIFDGAKKLETVTGAGPVELGRQQSETEALYALIRQGDRNRVAVAPLEDRAVPRRHVLVEPVAEGRVRLTNLSDRVRLGLAGVGELKPNESREVPLPAALQLGSRTVRLHPQEAPPEVFEQLDHPTISPAAMKHDSAAFATIGLTGGNFSQMEDMVRWFQATLAVLYGAAFSGDFFARAARSAVELLGLDAALVLRRQGDGWHVEARHQANPTAPETVASQNILGRVLGRVLAERRTFWKSPGAGAKLEGSSLLNVRAVVAAPILGRNEEVIGVLYGDRRQAGGRMQAITRLEALLAEVLAGGVAAGLARVEQEAAALRTRVLFSQFFTPGLALHLTGQEDLLTGRDTEVSVLVCDIRGFSKVSERLGPAKTVEWINAVMGAVSDCVLAEEGVVVDYIGDEMMAMWGAPVAQADHAARAGRAALAMLASLPALNEEWQAVVGEPLGLGIGVNTGTARVGNVGSARKFKYGPLGNTVNLASRVQGATKHLKTRLLATQSTHAQLPPDIQRRRLCKVRVVGINEPVDLYELLGTKPEARQPFHEEYENALTQFEGGRFGTAVRILGNMVMEHPMDGPALVLLSRAVNALVHGPADQHPVWELPGK